MIMMMILIFILIIIHVTNEMEKKGLAILTK